MRVLVTGCSGHVGGAVAHRLAEAGHEVWGLSRTHAETLPEAVRQVRVDLAMPDCAAQAAEALPACEAVVHAAACLSKAPGDPGVVNVNCRGTQAMLALAQQWQSAAFLFISGVGVLGQPRELPVTEARPARPETAYTASKLFGEHLARIAGTSGALRTVTLRLTSPVGPGLRQRTIFRIFAERALAGQQLLLHGAGTREQDYVDVRDAAAAAAAALERPAHGLFNIGGAALSNRALAEQCVAALGSASEVAFSGEPAPDDAVRWRVSWEKARRELGYAPRFPIGRSIQDFAAELNREPGYFTS